MLLFFLCSCFHVHESLRFLSPFVVHHVYNLRRLFVVSLSLFFFALIPFADVPGRDFSSIQSGMRFFNRLFHVPWNDFFEVDVTIRISSRYRLFIVDLSQIIQLIGPFKLHPVQTF